MEIESRVGDIVTYSEVIHGRKRRIKTRLSQGTERVERLFEWLRSNGGEERSQPTPGLGFQDP